MTLVTHQPKWQPTDKKLVCVHELENGSGECGDTISSLSEMEGAHACIVEPVGAFTCTHCGRTSWNPNDLSQRYCGNCHHFCDDVERP